MSKISLIQEIMQTPTVRPGAKAQRSAGNAGAVGHAGLNTGTEGSRVQLSAAARQLLAGNGAPVDTKRVEAITAEVKAGTYHINVNTVAHDIAASIRAVLAPSRKSR